MEEKLKEGFYRIKLYGDWIIAEYIGEGWYETGNEIRYDFHEPEVIGDLVIADPKEAQKRLIQDVIKDDENDGLYDDKDTTKITWTERIKNYKKIIGDCEYCEVARWNEKGRCKHYHETKECEELKFIFIKE